MSDFELTETRYGFDWGPLKVERVASDRSFGVVLWLMSKSTGQVIEARLSPKGHRFDVKAKGDKAGGPEAVAEFQGEEMSDVLKRALQASRAEVKGRGHDWDVADALAAVLAVLEGGGTE